MALFLLLLGLVLWGRLEAIVAACLAACSFYTIGVFGEESSGQHGALTVALTATFYLFSLYAITGLVVHSTGLKAPSARVASLALVIAGYYLFSSGLIIDLLVADLSAMQGAGLVSFSVLLNKLGSVLNLGVTVSIIYASLWLIIEAPFRIAGHVVGADVSFDLAPYRLLVAIALGFFTFRVISDWILAALA